MTSSRAAITERTGVKLTLGTIVGIVMAIGLWLLNDVRDGQRDVREDLKQVMALQRDTRERVSRLEGAAGLGSRPLSPEPTPRPDHPHYPIDLVTVPSLRKDPQP